MNKLVETTLGQIEEEGLSLSIRDDLDDIVELHALADAFTSAAPSPEFSALLEPELRVGGKVLRRLSMGARDFFNEHPAVWFEADDEWIQRSLFYCMAEGHRPGHLWAYATPGEFKNQVRCWARDVSASWRAMEAAVRRFLAIEARADVEANNERQRLRPDHGWLIEALCSEYGHEPHYWVWECPEGVIDLLWKRLLDRKDAENRASGKQGVARNPDTPATRALFKFRDAEARLLEKLKARS